MFQLQEFNTNSVYNDLQISAFCFNSRLRKEGKKKVRWWLLNPGHLSFQFMLCTAKIIFYTFSMTAVTENQEVFVQWNISAWWNTCLHSTVNSCMQNLRKHKYTKTHTQDFWAHTMGSALCPKKMKCGVGLGSPTLSISPRPDLTEHTLQAH